MSKEELTAWIVLGIIYVFCGIATIFIAGAERK
jgi:hypothetical protein